MNLWPLSNIMGLSIIILGFFKSEGGLLNLTYGP